MATAVSASQNRLDRRHAVAIWLHLGSLFGLGVLELVAITVRFDGETLSRLGGSWSARMQTISSLARYASAAGLLTFAFGGRTILDLLGTNRGSLTRRRRAFALVLGQLTAYAAFVGVTGWIYEGAALGTRAGLALGLWVASGLLVAVFWLWALLPWDMWLELGRRCWWALGAGIAASGLAALLRDPSGATWEWLRGVTFRTVSTLLSLYYNDLVVDPIHFVIGTSRFSVTIAPECSGLEGMGLVVGFLVVYLVLFRRELRFPEALFLLPLGGLAIWTANALRIAALVILGTEGAPAVARGGFHSQAGWLAFNGVALGLVIVCQRSRLFHRREERHATAESASAPGNPAAPLLLPLLAIVATSMVTGAFSPGGFDLMYPIRVVTAALVLIWFHDRYRGMLRPSWSPLAVVIGLAVFVVWLILEPSTGDPRVEQTFLQGLNRLPPWGAGLWLVFRFVGTVVTVPIAEELAFREYLTRRLVSPDIERVPSGYSTWGSLLISSFAFGLLHGRWMAGTLAGLAYAVVWSRRGRVSDAILAHAVTNLALALFVVVEGRWSLWS